MKNKLFIYLFILQAAALYEDAAGLAAGEQSFETRGITVDDLKAEMAKHDGLLEGLSIK